MDDCYVCSVLADCSICGRIHQVEKWKGLSEAFVKNEFIAFEYYFYKCEDNRFITPDLKRMNEVLACDAYRKKYGLLTSEEIVSIRKQYGLSQNDFSALLGWGKVSIKRYEMDHVQSRAYDTVLRQVMDDPHLMFRLLENGKDSISSKAYQKALRKIQALL